MTTATPRGRHRADRPITTPITIVARAAAENAGALARKGAIAAAGAGVLVSTLATSAHAAPATDVKTRVTMMDLDAISSTARTAVAAAPIITVASDAAFSVEQAAVSVTPPPAPKPVVPIGSRAVSIALQYVGIMYTWGGESPVEGFDCSGLIKYTYAKLGVSLPHSSASLRYAGTVVSTPRPGDLVWTPGHVALYAGNGMVIEAYETGKPVRYTEMWQDNPVFVRVA